MFQLTMATGTCNGYRCVADYIRHIDDTEGEVGSAEVAWKRVQVDIFSASGLKKAARQPISLHDSMMSLMIDLSQRFFFNIQLKDPGCP